MAYITDKKSGKAKYVPDSDLKPDTNNTSSVSYSSSAEPKAKKNVYTSDNLGVRDSLNALGYNNDQIGWDGKNVTYKGQYLLTPEKNDNGVTKTSTNNLISSVNNSYKSRGIDDSVVDVTAYAAGATKLPKAVTHDNGVVSVGGVPIQNTVIIDGVAYAPRSAIDSAISTYNRNPGPYTKKTNEFLDTTARKADEYADKISNYEPFSYEPENDPAYIAYRDAYMRNAKKALNDTYAENAARTGGYANSAAITASNQAYYNHMDELADRIPDLMDNAYERYLSDFDMLLEGSKLYGSPYERYLLESDALRLDRAETANALEADYERDMDTRNFNYGAILDERDYDLELWERDNILAKESELLDIEIENAIRNGDVEYALLLKQLAK